jgi:hypothetical protein
MEWSRQSLGQQLPTEVTTIVEQIQKRIWTVGFWVSLYLRWECWVTWLSALIAFIVVPTSIALFTNVFNE